MTERNHFTPFIVDDPGPDARESMLFDGEAKRRAEFRPCRFMVGALLIIGFFTLFGAMALAGQQLVELEHRYQAEALV